MPFAVVGGTHTVPIAVADSGSGLTGNLKVEEGTGGYGAPNVGPFSVTWSAVSQSGSSGSVTLTRTPPGAGTYGYRATVSDVAGNTLTPDGLGKRD